MRTRMKEIAGVALIALIATACDQDTRADQRTVALLEGAPADTLIVYKTAACGCCRSWVDHVEANGFAVIAHDLDYSDLEARKQQLGVPAGRISCHTSTVRGYTIEGHVPADLIRRLLDEKPAGVRGLAVPGMPAGSPGMEGIIKQEYDVLSFDDQGNVAVYARR